jgi:hypothetical protein
VKQDLSSVLLEMLLTSSKQPGTGVPATSFPPTCQAAACSCRGRVAFAVRLDSDDRVWACRTEVQPRTGSCKLKMLTTLHLQVLIG